jgi:hypothetical protein
MSREHIKKIDPAKRNALEAAAAAGFDGTAGSARLERRPTGAPTMAAALLWTWRILLLAVVAYGVWGVWWQNVQLENIDANLIQMLDYLELEPKLVE